ncbi:MAG: flagellar hook protein FlgE [Thermodesulfobacteriota bacterium]|nr:flagellar hook protein FlgE [Thermodesulfobacteriota bacterium]
MSISNSLFSAISGLSAFGETMSIIGNNISNINTIGFKSSRVVFEDALTQAVATAAGSSNVGRGVELSTITTSFNQGSFENTNETTDLAIGGKGFFVVKVAGSTSDVYYTRAGQFRFDKDANLVNPHGLIVQGWQVQESVTGEISTVGAIVDINIQSDSSDPNPTANIYMAVNLDATAQSPTAGDFDLADKDNTSNYVTTISAYDSLGTTHPVSIYFRKTATAGLWQWFAVVDASNTASGSEEVQAAGTLTFNEGGVLLTQTQATAGQTVGNYTIPTPAGFDFSGGATQNQAITFGFGIGSSSVPKSTQYSSSSTTVFQTQDGYGSGYLQNISVDTDGVISGHYSNGQILPLFKVALANFSNPWGLDNKGSNLFAESRESGQVVTGPPGSVGLGKISSNSLEQSNVDLGTEFVKMIITQRAFQANSRIITSTDELLVELINMKR